MGCYGIQKTWQVGLRVSEIGLGSWLTYGGAIEEQSAAEQIRFAFDSGINFFDTANVYADGNGEVAVGKALKQLKRHEYVVATKVFFPMGGGPNDRGLSRKHVIEQCHASLDRLRVDYIDIYQCHRFDPDVPMYELVRTMDDLIRQGKILYWGVSEWSADQIESAVEIAHELNAMPPVSNQPQYNMLQRTVEADVIPTCTKLGLGQLVFSPLAQGVLSGKYRPGQPFPNDSRAANPQLNAFLVGRPTLSKQSLEIVERLSTLARDELGISMAALALAWCLRIANVSSVIMGATKKKQIEENIKASGLRLAPDMQSKIESILTPLVIRS